jgi:hypothetical protein
MFGLKAGMSAVFGLSDIPEMRDSVERVWRLCLDDAGVMNVFSHPFIHDIDWIEVEDAVKNEVIDFISDIISRAEALAVDADQDILDIYLKLEKARFAKILRGDLVVPMALTKLDVSQPLEVSSNLHIEPLDEPMQCARAVSWMQQGRASPLVISAATHAVVIRDIEIANEYAGTYRPVEVDLSLVDRVLECIHMKTGVETGYAQAVVRPKDWADGWRYGLPAVRRVGTYHKYPDHFDDGGWLLDMEAVPADCLDSMPRIYESLIESRPNVRLAARRSFQSMLRNDPDDEILDSTIGLEALLIGDNEKEGITYRMAQRAAIALSTESYDPGLIADLFKRVYDERSSIVHGRLKRKQIFELEGGRFTISSISSWLLRALLTNLLESEEPWSTKNLDERILRSFSRGDNGL